MATCDICKYAGTPSYKSPCSECKGYSKYEYEKPVTNADRIRGMSDKELAEIIMCPYGSEPDLCCTICCTKGTCLDCCEEWLQQPVEEETK